jgi:hypothetical protein
MGLKSNKVLQHQGDHVYRADQYRKKGIFFLRISTDTSTGESSFEFE